MTTKPTEEKKTVQPKEEKPVKAEKKSDVLKLEVKPVTNQESAWDTATPKTPADQPVDVTWPPLQDNTPQVVVRGKAAEPIGTVTYTGGDSLQYNDINFYLPWPTERFKDMSFNIYQLEDKGRKINLAMDPLSKFVIEPSPSHFHFVPGNPQFTAPAVIVLINSTSSNDYVVGESLLINVESRNNVLNNSQLTASRKDQGRSYGLFAYEKTEDVFKVGEDHRHTYVGCRFKRSRIENALLSDGYYFETQIVDSEIKSNGRIDVRGGRVTRSRLVGSDITLNDANLVQFSAECTGSIRVNRQTLNAELYTTSGLYLNNKFAKTTITAPHYSDIRLVRVSLNEFELGDGYNSVTLKINEGSGEVMDKVESLFARMKGKVQEETNRERYDRAGMDNFTRSILRYVTDSVASRLRIIEMIDSAAETLESVLPRANKFEPYDTAFDL